jgi:tricorn protease interacting factor F2/3
MQRSSYNLVPKNYSLEFDPDIELFIYSGREVLTFTLESKEKEVWLDAVGLEVSSCALLSKKGNREVCQKRVENNKLYITFPKALDKGAYELEILFSGVISDHLAGWYKSRYIVDGKLKYCATTQFEAADARRAFPCIDHPNFKATFDISLMVPEGMVAISNMEIIKNQIKSKKRMVSFKRTPVMSTYLVYIGVGEFEWIEEKFTSLRSKDRKIIIRGTTNPGKKEYARFAVQEAKRYLGYFEEYFGVAYPLPKLDLIALSDFAIGAMENWGAITFRENAMLYYPGRTSAITKQHLTETIAHELAHQWFGNLVTMKWWEDLWLNESFATFMACKAVNYFYPEWHMWTNYVIDTVFEGMSLDSMHSSHAIQVKVEDVEKVTELFDEIAYEKGGSILRMLEEYLTHDVFRKGLQVYIKKFAYKNAAGIDLWGTLEEVSGKPVVKVMESFIKQVGFPEVKVEEKGRNLVLKQERFLLLNQESQVSSQRWVVPLVWADEKGVKRHLLEDMNEELKTTSSFVNMNFGYAGFYITGYEKRLLKRLGKNISKIAVQERLGLVHDFYYFVLAGRKTVKEFIDFIEQYFMKEENPTVLSYLISKLTGLYLILEGEIAKQLQEVATRISHAALCNVSREPVEGEDSEHVILRNSALHALGLFGHVGTVAFALEKFEAFLNEEGSLHQDLRGTIYALAVWASEDNYQAVLDLYKKTQIQEERTKFLSALARTKDKSLLLQTMDYSLSTEVSFSNVVYIFASLSRNPYAKDLAVDWVIRNWENLVVAGGGMGDMILRRILKFVIPILGIGRQEEIAQFLGGVNGMTLERTFEQVKEELEIHSRLVKRESLAKIG